MNYTSTRNSSISVTATDAIVQGISEEGGLFVPTELPKLNESTLLELANKPCCTYQEKAFEILKLFLNFADEDIKSCVNNAYNQNFKTLDVTRLVGIEPAAYMLELWHGPTAAFKDMALQILPEMLRVSTMSLGKTGKLLILVATSGDTGKAALEGFKDVQGIEIAVFYPENGVSDVQKLQMTTQEGGNVHVFAVEGNFDDCQNAVKSVFTDREVIAEAKSEKVSFSSANSINWGRLCPQIIYYISAYTELVRKKAIKFGDKVNICVPTGNFGNILAAYYAMEMGMPVNKLICASNTNKILSDFIETGVYDCNREFHTTVSPSMDILVSSNLERLLYHLSGNNDGLVNGWFSSLKETGKFEVEQEVKDKIKALFYGGWCSEEKTAQTIKTVFEEQGYLMDTHTAVGYKVYKDYIGRAEKSKIKTIIVSTANPYKFSEAVYESLNKTSLDEIDGLNEKDDVETTETNPNCDKSKLDYMNELVKYTNIAIPKPLASIGSRKVRFAETLKISEIKEAVMKIVKGE